MLGLTIAHLGVTLFLLSNLGSAPFNVLIQGIANILPLSHGTCHQIICFLILGILLFVARSYIKAGTFICMFFGGPIIDFFSWLLGGFINDSSSIIIRVIVDFSFVIIGMLLGGIFGVGTIVCAFLIGPIADRFLPISEKLVQKLLQQTE